MFLKKAKVNGFGKIIDKEFHFKPGINIIFGQNESGKTTLAKFLLYSLSEPSPDVLKYKPWHSDNFGGTVETSDGLFNFGEVSKEKYNLNLLEIVAFLMEDDDLENVKIDKNIIESSLKKKSDRTETGKAIKMALNNIENLKISDCFNKISLELEQIKSKIENEKEKIFSKNQNYLKKKNITEKLKSLEKNLLEMTNELEKLRKENTSYLENEISREKSYLEELSRKYKELKWVEDIDQNIIFELSSLIMRIDALKNELKRLDVEGKAIEHSLEQKNKEIEERFKLIGATSHEDLESISLRLKHLNLLSKMYGENVQETSTEEPLWHVFIQDSNIIDRAEDEEQKYTERKHLIEQQKFELQSKIEKLETVSKYSKDLSILSAVAGVVLLSLGLLFSKIALLLYLPSAIFLTISTFLLIKWRKSVSNISVLQENLLEISLKQPEQPQIWKLLAQYGIRNLKDLRKKYTEFLEWKSANTERQRKINELKDIEQEMIKELSRFGVVGAGQMLISAVENLQRTFIEVQELIYEKESIERKLNQLKNDYLGLQKELKNLVETLEDELKKHNITKQDVENYKYKIDTLQQIKNEIFEHTKSLKSLEEKYKDEDSNQMIRNTKNQIRLMEAEVEKLKSQYTILSKEYEEIFVNFDDLNNLLKQKDELELRLKLISLINSYIPSVTEFLKQSYSAFVENYYKTFSEEFSKFFYYVVGEEKNFFVTPELTIKILVEGDLKEPNEYLSASSKDLVIFGIKNALYKSFYDNNIPLVIDNTLIRFDDNRLKKVCTFLKDEANFRQIILLTSDKRIIEYIGSSNNIIYLEG